jgi:hypothetical protein
MNPQLEHDTSGRMRRGATVETSLSQSSIALPEVGGEVDGEISRPRIQPVHVMVVYNDDDHTFDYVIDLFAEASVRFVEFEVSRFAVLTASSRDGKSATSAWNRQAGLLVVESRDQSSRETNISHTGARS